MSADSRTNRLLVRDAPAILHQLHTWVDALDQPIA
ncbi:MAG: secretin N-terminal domain-containing protein [Candidatus Malihini olakiniferum]